MRTIRFENVSKSYQGESIIKNLNLEIPGGKFFALLGPSGCGKTTLLRLVAGLERLDEGKIFLGEEEITNTPIYKRRIHTIFQDYALFPHLNVFENIAYSLRIIGTKSSAIKDKVMAFLDVIRLKGHENKSIHNLSGGQKQRVALARSIISEPVVLLLDEPLAALDPRLKEEMLIELIDLQEKFKTTFIYVTHDQEEALTVADSMAIMNHDGEIEQTGTPKDIYEFPASRFVANFVGTTNLLEAKIKEKSNEIVKVEVPDLGVFDVYAPKEKNGFNVGDKIYISLRPEKIDIVKSELQGFDNHIKGRVSDIIYSGRATKYHVALPNKKIIKVFEQNDEHFPQEDIDYSDEVNLYFQKENVVLLK